MAFFLLASMGGLLNDVVSKRESDAPTNSVKEWYTKWLTKECS